MLVSKVLHGELSTHCLLVDLGGILLLGRLRLPLTVVFLVLQSRLSVSLLAQRLCCRRSHNPMMLVLTPLTKRPSHSLRILVCLPSMVSSCRSFSIPADLLPLAKARSNIIPQGSSSTQGAVPFYSLSCKPLFYPGTDDEDKEDIQNPRQGQGAIDGEVFAGVGAEAPTPSAPVHPDLVPGPPPYYRQDPEISFVFDDITGDWDPYPTIFLPRPQCSVPSEQELRRSSRPRASPVGHDAAYLIAAQGSQAKKDKKNDKHKNKGTDTAAPHKRARRGDNNEDTAGEPAPKKPKVKEVVTVSDDER